MHSPLKHWKPGQASTHIYAKAPKVLRTERDAVTTCAQATPSELLWLVWEKWPRDVKILQSAIKLLIYSSRTPEIRSSGKSSQLVFQICLSAVPRYFIFSLGMSSFKITHVDGINFWIGNPDHWVSMVILFVLKVENAVWDGMSNGTCILLSIFFLNTPLPLPLRDVIAGS